MIWAQGHITASCRPGHETWHSEYLIEHISLYQSAHFLLFALGILEYDSERLETPQLIAEDKYVFDLYLYYN